MFNVNSVFKNIKLSVFLKHNVLYSFCSCHGEAFFLNTHFLKMQCLKNIDNPLFW